MAFVLENMTDADLERVLQDVDSVSKEYTPFFRNKIRNNATHNDYLAREGLDRKSYIKWATNREKGCYLTQPTKDLLNINGDISAFSFEGVAYLVSMSTWGHKEQVFFAPPLPTDRRSEIEAEFLQALTIFRLGAELSPPVFKTLSVGEEMINVPPVFRALFSGKEMVK